MAKRTYTKRNKRFWKRGQAKTTTLPGEPMQGIGMTPLAALSIGDLMSMAQRGAMVIFSTKK